MSNFISDGHGTDTGDMLIFSNWSLCPSLVWPIHLLKNWFYSVTWRATPKMCLQIQFIANKTSSLLFRQLLRLKPIPLLHLKPVIIFVASLDQRGPINLDISVWSKRSDGMKRPEKLLRFVHLFGWMRYIWNILYCIIFPYQWKGFKLKATPHSFQFHILSTRVKYW